MDPIISMDDDYDAFDDMFNRGAYLRKLREMEAQDEAERAAAAEDESYEAPSDTLRYEAAYLQAGQAYYDDYKHVNYRFIDFGCVGGTEEEGDKENTTDNTTDNSNKQEPKEALPLMIEQDRTVGKGGFVWDAGFVLAEHILHEQDEWKPLVQRNNNKPIRMVELGAGTGVTGLMVATAMQEVHMSLTDLPELMPLLQKNLALNPSAKTTAFPLPWGTNVQGNYDVILGADCVAGIYDPVKLAKTICDLCHENTLVYLAVNKRLDEIIATFEDAMGKLFECVEHRTPVSRNKNPNVSILVATKKRSNQ